MVKAFHFQLNMPSEMSRTLIKFSRAIGKKYLGALYVI
jgi:hypothetical protein